MSNSDEPHLRFHVSFDSFDTVVDEGDGLVDVRRIPEFGLGVSYHCRGPR